MNNKGNKTFITLSLVPATILFFIFIIIPTMNVFWMSLFKWGGLINNKKFVGLDNFIMLFKDSNFLKSFQNPNQGIVNSTLNFFNLNSLTRMWLGDQKVVIWCIAFAMIWQAIGYYMVMYMSSISGISISLYESASLDGATGIQQFFKITLPLVWNTIRTTLTFFVISTINLSFLFVKVMTSGGPDGSSEVFLSYMYKQAYSNSSYGYGMTIGVVVFIFSFILSLAINKITQRDIIEF